MSELRKYDNADDAVHALYYDNRSRQTLDFGRAQKLGQARHNRGKASVGELFAMADRVVDPSDPDTLLTQLQHALQTAEATRTKFPEPRYDWLHLTALLHDLGKGPLALGSGEVTPLPMWAVVGDTFALGCRFDKRNVCGKGYASNPDAHDARYNSEVGIYERNCGFDQVVLSYGHDEYLANVLEKNAVGLPELGTYIIRYHSFYPWHQHGAYDALANKRDFERREWLQRFQQCDLYSKTSDPLPAAELLPYYKLLCEKYMTSWDAQLQL